VRLNTSNSADVTRAPELRSWSYSMLLLLLLLLLVLLLVIVIAASQLPLTERITSTSKSTTETAVSPLYSLAAADRAQATGVRASCLTNVTLTCPSAIGRQECLPHRLTCTTRRGGHPPSREGHSRFGGVPSCLPVCQTEPRSARARRGGRDRASASAPRRCRGSRRCCGSGRRAFRRFGRPR